MPFAMGIAATISLFDWKSRSFDAFVGTSYPHPVIRWAIIQWVIRERLGWDTVAAQAWEFHSERALRMVNGRIGAATLVESERVQAEDPNFELGLPIAQLQMDKSRFGQSVRFDYLIRSIERGRRAEYALNDFSAEDMPLQPFMADVDALWQAYLARLRIMNAERSKN